MILNQEKKVQFLTELLENIQRIYNQNLTESDEKHFVKKRFPSPRFTLKEESGTSLLSDCLPRKIKLEITPWAIPHFTTKLTKLDLLTDLYNYIENEAQKNEDLNLDDAFAEFKKHNTYELDYDPISPEQVMKLHRRESELGSGLLARILRFFITPKSESFLGKHGFFNKSAIEPTKDEDSHKDSIQLK